jgi:hypothetical protein
MTGLCAREGPHAAAVAVELGRRSPEETAGSPALRSGLRLAVHASARPRLPSAGAVTRDVLVAASDYNDAERSRGKTTGLGM